MTQFSVVTRVVLLLACIQRVWADYDWYFDFTPTVVAEFTSVRYNWTGSPWATANDAANAGAYVIANNVVTGVNRYGDATFLCIPRWRHGIPSTLNQLAWDSSGPLLTPWPDWNTNINVFHYVQAVFVDQLAGEIWVIDAGRENFFDADTSLLQNRAASLYIYAIVSRKLVQTVTFPDAILPFNSSFLNDIVVDVKTGTAYMSDTNTAGKGAVISYNRFSGAMFRFEDPHSTYAQPGFVVNVDGVDYPKVQNPTDGIALSGDGLTFFYSAVDGSRIHSIPTIWLTPGSTNVTASAAHVTILTDKQTASDGLMWLPTSAMGHVSYGIFPSPAVGALDLGSPIPSVVTSPATLYADEADCQWVDTFAVQPWFNVSGPAIPRINSWYYNGIQGFSLYFTTNKLQIYFNNSMDFSGATVNMRLFRLDFSPHLQQDIARARLLLGIGVGLLVIVFAVYFFFFRRFAAPMQGPLSKRQATNDVIYRAL